MRPERKYHVVISDDSNGSPEEHDIIVPAGEVDQQDAEAHRQARELTIEYVRGGEWGAEGALPSPGTTIWTTPNTSMRGSAWTWTSRRTNTL